MDLSKTSSSAPPSSTHSHPVPDSSPSPVGSTYTTASESGHGTNDSDGGHFVSASDDLTAVAVLKVAEPPPQQQQPQQQQPLMQQLQQQQQVLMTQQPQQLSLPMPSFAEVTSSSTTTTTFSTITATSNVVQVSVV
jgi:hypothetical protein